MKYSHIMEMLPRLLRSEEAEDYVGGDVMLRELGVRPLKQRKGLTIYDRVDLDKAIDNLKAQKVIDARNGAGE